MKALVDPASNPLILREFPHDKERHAWPFGAYRLCFIALVVLYVAIYGGILGISHGMPYAVDNNESFETLNQAQNMYRFGLENTFGLTDESNGPNAAQHPYVYTHQGNLARLWSLLLYGLGAKTIEPQIVITTFTVGIAGLWLMYAYLSRISSPLFALIGGAVFNTDYLLFSQWQVNTLRVWHAVFLFACLSCAHLVATRSKRWWALTFVLYLALVYFDDTFAIFTIVLYGIYIAFVHRSWRTCVFGWSCQLAGASIGVVIILLQLIAYYGLNGLRQDFYLTYLSRNYAGADPAVASKLNEFLSTYHVLFWENTVEGSSALAFPRAAEDLYHYTFGLLMTPFADMSVAVRVAVPVLMLGAVLWGFSKLRLHSKGWGDRGVGHVTAFLLAGCSAYVLTLLLLPGYVVSTYLQRYAPLAVFLIDVFLAGICYGLFASARAAWREQRHSSFLRVSSAVGVTILLVGFVAVWLYAQMSNLRQYPPTVLSGLERLREPPYAGASFAVSNAYRSGAGAYVAASLTGQWAYFDRVLGYKPVEIGVDGVDLQRDTSAIWFADRATNPAYVSPDYFMCFFPPTPDQVAANATGAWPDCSKTVLVQSALLTLPPESKPYLEPAGHNYWAIVDLRQLRSYLESIRLPQAVQFTNGMTIVGLDQHAGQVIPGVVLHPALVWQATRHIDFDYSAFVRLRDARGNLIHGPDHEPGMQYKLPIPNWNRGLLVRDDWELPIPPDATPGDYQFEVGVYNYQTMAAVKSLDGRDAETLGTLTIRRTAV